MKKAQYMAIDQYGRTHHSLTHPRKELCERLGYRHAERMYQDRDGQSYHVGWIIGPFWCTVYHVEPMCKPV